MRKQELTWVFFFFTPLPPPLILGWLLFCNCFGRFSKKRKGTVCYSLNTFIYSSIMTNNDEDKKKKNILITCNIFIKIKFCISIIRICIKDSILYSDNACVRISTSSRILYWISLVICHRGPPSYGWWSEEKKYVHVLDIIRRRKRGK